MRGIYSSLTKIRRKVFVEVAKLAYEGNDSVSYTHLDVYKRQNP